MTRYISKNFLCLILFFLWTTPVFAQSCAKTASCAEMGFTKTAAQCTGKSYLKCPFDNSKYFCNDGIIGEIRIFAGTSIPKGWSMASDQTLSALAYPKLYAAIGSTFGGNSTAFKLPNLNTDRRFALGVNSSYRLGKKGGEKEHTLTISEMPSHQHVGPWGEKDDYSCPYGKYGSNRKGCGDNDWDNMWNYTSSVGGSGAHNNMPPYLGLYFIIYTGVY